MVPVSEQVHSGRLVCPRTRQRLFYSPDGRQLTTEDGARRYTVLNGVPLFLGEQTYPEADRYGGGDSMLREYVRPHRRWFDLKLRVLNLIHHFGGDYRSALSANAFREVMSGMADRLCVSIGGGPHRVHEDLVNLNIGAFANVDVVADAYELPYRDASVDALHCEAVLEHLEQPDKAVGEMFRVLVPGGQVFASTPFMHCFHGYPNHFQNFTTEGHKRLFERAGFEILSFGPAVGPLYALVDFLAVFAREYVPTWFLSRCLTHGIRLLALPIKPLDLLLNKSPAAAVLAATTYVHCRKPL